MTLRYTVDRDNASVTVLVETDSDVTLYANPDTHGLEPANPRELQHFVAVELDESDLLALLAVVQSADDASRKVREP